MMVNTKIMYKFFTDSINEKIIELEKENDIVTKRILNSANSLAEFKTFIETTYKIDYEKFINIRTEKAVNAILEDVVNSNNLIYIKSQFKFMIQNLNRQGFLKNKINEIKKSFTTYKKYKFIVAMFNEQVSDKIIKSGYTLNFGNNLGSIRIRKKERTSKYPINWEASNIKKQKLIDAGIKPYHKENSPNGTKWLIRFTEKYGYYWYWTKYNCNKTNRNLYSFRPTAGLYGNIKKLNQYIKHNPLVKLKYKL